MHIFSWILLLVVFSITIETAASNNIFSSIFSSFGRKKPTTTPAPSYAKGTASRCNMKTSQCSAYECCNSDQTCLRNRCFPRISNCPVTRDQCGNACCKTSEQCRNGQCAR